MKNRPFFFGSLIGAILLAAGLWALHGGSKPSPLIRQGSGSLAPTPDPRGRAATNEGSPAYRGGLGGTPPVDSPNRGTEAWIDASRNRPVGTLRERRLAARQAKRDQEHAFDQSLLAALEFRPEDIDWVRERWERAELERREREALEARGEEPMSGSDHSDIDRALREDLGDRGYDAALYATRHDNRVSLHRLRADSVAQKAGIAAGSQVWSYDGQRVFSPKELARLSTAEGPGDPVEIVVVTPDGTERLFVERGPLGAELVGARGRPAPW